jgi:hypothetical protein
MMANAKELPTVEFPDYAFVFAHQGLVRNDWSIRRDALGPDPRSSAL